MNTNCPGRQALLDALQGGAAEVDAHLASCAGCRSVQAGLRAAADVLARTPWTEAAGDCPAEAELAAYVRRALDPGRERALEEHVSACEDCTDALVSLAEALEAQPGEVPASLERRVLKLGAPTRRRARVFPKRRPLAPYVVAAAAALLVIAILVLARPSPSTPGPSAQRPKPVVDPPRPKEPEPGVPSPAPKEPPPPVPAPPREEPKPVVAPPIRIPDPVPPPPAPPPREEPKPPVDPVKTIVKEPEPPKYHAVKLTALHGELRRRDGAALAAGAALARGDEVVTDARHYAGFVLEGGIRGVLGRDSSLKVEEREDGETRLTLVQGAAFFEVDPRPRPLVVAATAAEAVVLGTSFQVAIQKTALVLSVVEGAVKFRNEKGEALVKAGQRSSARPGERPSAPVRANLEAEVAWARRPDLRGNPDKAMYVEQVPGGNRKLAGLVVAAPYAAWEVDAGRLARSTSDRLDAGLALGHHHRDRADKKVWMNIDRGTEGEVRADGTTAPAGPTERAKAVTAEYLGALRAASGTAGERPVPMIVQLRNHSEPIEVCELAWAGWNKRTMAELKVLYGQLLDKHKPGRRVELRVEGIDDSYEHKGMKRKFLFTESDAESDGYMAPRHSQNAAAFFFPADLLRQPADLEAYPRIFAELIEFLHARKR